MRTEELIEGRPELIATIRPLLEARNAVGQQVSELDHKVMRLARHDAQVRRFMTVLELSDHRARLQGND